MKIVYFHQGLWPSNSPSTTFVTFNLLGFQRNGYNFQLVTTRNKPGKISDILKEYFNINEELNIKLINGGLIRKNHRIIYLKAFSYFLKTKFDVLITRNLGFLRYGLMLRKLKKIRVFYESHDFFTDLSIRDDIDQRSKLKFSQMERKYIPKLNGVICVSKQMKKIYEKYYPHQFFISATTGTTPNFLKLNRNGFNYFLGYIGSFNFERYNIHTLFEAFKYIKNPKIKLIMIGAKNDYELDYAKTLSKKFGVYNRVELYKWQKLSKIQNFKEKIDFGCALIKNKFMSKIVSPLKVLDYLSSGIPVLASNSSGIADILTDSINGYLIENSAKKWAKIIDLAYSDFDKYKIMKKNCETCALELSWENRARKIITAINEKKFYEN
jgi:glycosyltransferase involved in cell wall biosynthesis